jgi:mRNA interferase HigB
VQIIAIKRLRKYAKKHPDAAAALTYLEALFRKAKWKDINEVRKQRKDCDLAPVNSGRILQVFNVREDYYRLIVHIHFNRQKIFIREFMTHKEYDREDWKKRN